MGSTAYRKGAEPFGSAPHVLLSCTWLVGFILGLVIMYCFRSSLSEVLPLLRLFHSKVSLKLMLTLLPFLLSVLTVSLSGPSWLYLICAIKAVCFSAHCLMLYLCYGQAGWLACWLFMFSDICSLPFLFLYWSQHISGTACSLRKHFAFSLIVALLAIVDYGIVTPYAVKFLII